MLGALPNIASTPCLPEAPLLNLLGEYTDVQSRNSWMNLARDSKVVSPAWKARWRKLRDGIGLGSQQDSLERGSEQIWKHIWSLTPWSDRGSDGE
jgi:hypothetical protein